MRYHLPYSGEPKLTTSDTGEITVKFVIAEHNNSVLQTWKILSCNRNDINYYPCSNYEHNSADRIEVKS